MATAAAVATVGCSSKDDKPIDRSWPDTSGRLPPSATSRFGSSSSGYAVVDPMPMPSRCSTVSAGAVTGTATRRTRTDGNVDVVIELEAARPPEPIEIAQVTGIGGGFIGKASVTRVGAKWIVTSTVGPMAASMVVSASVTCGPEQGALKLGVEWGKPGLTEPYAVTVTASPW